MKPKPRHADIKYKWEKMTAASISNSLPSFIASENMFSPIQSAVVIVSGQWRCFHQSKLFVNGTFTQHFLFSILWHFPFCLMHIFTMFYSMAMTLPKLHLMFWSILSRDFFSNLSLTSGGSPYIQKHLVEQTLQKCEWSNSTIYRHYQQTWSTLLSLIQFRHLSASARCSSVM